ncbi:hypothetical protein [Aquimarina sp. MMG016]|uniref:hypothetical protein n=1 Tax=Aquimarina sp. MMG016 TaxID=2822690 RepID=UPI001B3A14EB|nr:hypothetical protein [Aquimarina sp. MMG016]MBQ4820685.1 hypothetical protein [Aquimarina sp. MMG016]
MENLYKQALAVFILIFISGCASYGPKDNKLSVILSGTQQAVTNLAEKITITEDQDLIAKYYNLEKKYEELFPVLIKCNEKYALTTTYMSTLEEAQKSLQRLYKNFDDITDKSYMLESIYLDYDAKLQSINSSAKSDANTTIKVTINSSEDEGFFVFGKLSYEQNLNIKRFRFNKPTQNASQDFVPGYYLFWLEKEDRVGEPELHLIMSNGKEEEKQLVLKTPK